MEINHGTADLSLPTKENDDSHNDMYQVLQTELMQLKES
jgi:hypothetical protein